MALPFIDGLNQVLRGMAPMNNAGGLLDPAETQSAQQQGLLGIGSGLLSAGGPSRYPISFGQALSAASLQGNAMQNNAIDSQLKRQLLVSEMYKNAMSGRETGINSRFRTPLMTQTGRAVTFDGQTGRGVYADTGELWNGAQDPLNKVQVVEAPDGSKQAVNLASIMGPAAAQSQAPQSPPTPPASQPVPNAPEQSGVAATAVTSQPQPSPVRSIISPSQALQATQNKADATSVGTGLGNRQIAAPNAYSAALNSLNNFQRFSDQAKRVADHPGLDQATGFGGETISGVAGTPAADAAAQIQTLQSQSFLNAFEALKELSKTGSSGLGSLSNTEGTKLQASWQNLQQSQTAGQYRKNLELLQQQIRQSMNLVRAAYNREFSHTKGAQIFEAPKEAIDMLNSDPGKYSKAFLDKYGYLP